MFHYDLEAHLNTDMCGWDGGDCCPSTCRMPDESDCDNVVYDCLDPDADDSGVVSDCTASVPSWIGDGYCDNNMNDASSAYEYVSHAPRCVSSVVAMHHILSTNKFFHLNLAVPQVQ